MKEQTAEEYLVKENVFETIRHFYFWILFFSTIILTAGSPDLLDAIIHHIMSSSTKCP